MTLLGAGWVLWLLLGLSILSVAVMLERALFFARRKLHGRFIDFVDLCESCHLAKAAALATGDSMEPEVVRRAAAMQSSNASAVRETVASTIHRRRLDYGASSSSARSAITLPSSVSSARCSASSALSRICRSPTGAERARRR